LWGRFVGQACGALQRLKEAADAML
jgi:hypothetical protein